MEYLYWTLIILLFVIAFIGLFYPIIPSVLFILGGFFLYGFLLFYIILNFFWMDVSCFGCMSADGRLAPFFWEYGGSSHLK